MDNQYNEQIQNINCVVSEIDGLYHQASVKLGLSDSEARVLYTLYVSEGVSPISEIYKQSGIGKQTVNSALRKLEAENVVFLEKIDGSAKQVKLTDTGREYAENTIAKLVELELNAYKCWNEKEIQQYLELSRKFKQAFREELEKI